MLQRLVHAVARAVTPPPDHHLTGDGDRVALAALMEEHGRECLRRATRDIREVAEQAVRRVEEAERRRDDDTAH